LQQKERVKGEITSSKDSKGQEGITGSKGQEARSKAEALFDFWQPCVSKPSGGQKKRQLLVGAESDVRHYRPLPAGARSVLPCHAV